MAQARRRYGTAERVAGILRHRHRDPCRIHRGPAAHRRVERADGAQSFQLLRVQPLPDVRHPLQGADLRHLPFVDCGGVRLRHGGGRDLPDRQPPALPYGCGARHHRCVELAVSELQQHRPADCHLHPRRSGAGGADPGHAAGAVHTGRADRARYGHHRPRVGQGGAEAALPSADAHRLAARHRGVGDLGADRLVRHPRFPLRPDRHDRRTGPRARPPSPSPCSRTSSCRWWRSCSPTS